MPWSGAGVFTRLYNFVQDAANGIKILASKQDDEWNNATAGLNNALCKDGQNSPTADIDWNGKRLKNLGAAVASGDALTLAQAQAMAFSEWTVESAGKSFVSATSFKVLGADKTATYHAGRRLKTTNTAGTIYSTVVSSSYGAPDTTVVVANDSGVLDSGLSAVTYGIAYTSPSYLDPRSYVKAAANATQAYLTASGWVKVNFANEIYDTGGEFDTGTSRFTAKKPGYYFVGGTVTYAPGSTATVAASLSARLNGSGTQWWLGNIQWSQTSGATYTVEGFTIVQLAAGDTLEIQVSISVNSTIQSGDFTRFDIVRLV